MLFLAGVKSANAKEKVVDAVVFFEGGGVCADKAVSHATRDDGHFFFGDVVEVGKQVLFALGIGQNEVGFVEHEAHKCRWGFEACEAAEVFAREAL